MYRPVFILFFLLLAPLSFSQSFMNSLNFELRYPIPVGKNFMNSNDLGSGYKGIIDAGAGINVFEVRNFSVGFQLSASVLSLSVSDLTATGITPKITASYDFRPGNISIIPQAAFGYTNWRFKSGDFLRSENGISMEVSLKMVLRSSRRINLYLQGAYQHTRLELPSYGEIDSDFNRNINTFYPGIGVLWKLK
jgi:hypothetical protein